MAGTLKSQSNHTGAELAVRNWRFLARPVWIVGHIVAATAVVSFISLGLWQFDRLDDRRAFNAAFTSQLEMAPVTLEQIDPLLADGTAAAEYRRVHVTGTFNRDEEVLLSTRSLDGTPGHHVLTPLETPAHGAVLVDRGWVPLDMGSSPPPVDGVEPPGGETTVTGVLFNSVEARTAGAQDGASSVLEFMSDVDVQRFAAEYDGPVYPMYVLAQDVDGANEASSPVYGPLPETDEGSHFSYAMQWMIFAGVVAIGYPVLLWQRALPKATPPPRPPGDG